EAGVTEGSARPRGGRCNDCERQFIPQPRRTLVRGETLQKRPPWGNCGGHAVLNGCPERRMAFAMVRILRAMAMGMTLPGLALSRSLSAAPPNRCGWRNAASAAM